MTSTQSRPLHGKGRECVITRRACFSSSHRYWLPEKTPEENLYSQADLRIQVKRENIEEVAMKIINAIHKEIIS